MLKRSTSDAILTAPATETLLSRDGESLWPREVINNSDLIVQTEMRQKCIRRLDELFRQIPDSTMEISDAVKTKKVRPEAAAELYELLASFLDADPHHRRLILYFPFELVPAKNWRPESGTLAASAERFASSYMRCWRELLEESSVRANFVDGDILEAELAPQGQPMVRKAAHLIPQLVRKELVSVAEVVAIMDNAASEILKTSIADALPTLVHASLPTKEKAAAYNEREIDPDWLNKFQDEVASGLERIEMRSALDLSRGMPKARVAWERLNKEGLLISAYAERIAKMLTADFVALENILSFLSPTTMQSTRLAAIRGVGMAVEELTKTNRARAARLSRKFMDGIKNLGMDGSPTGDELESVLTRWAHLGIITEEQLRGFGFEPPKLDAAFSKTSPLAAEIMKFSAMLKSISENPELSRFFYPIAVFFGSQLKGYAKRSADLDTAVFIKPGVSEKERDRVKKLLARTFHSKKIDGKIVEFWLEKHGEELRIRDFPDPDVLLADSTWVHILFGGAWLGQEEAMKELYAKLLPGFLRPSDKTFDGRDIRTILLGEMEREVLQYRLMHKGYRHFFPLEGGIDAPGAEGLNPESVFWDSGYRRLATKLFIARVFLPQLGPSKKQIGQ